MGIPRDLDLPWPPDRIGSGSIYDLNQTNDEPVKEKPPFGFAALVKRAPQPQSARRIATCSSEAPCGWCPECFEVEA